MITGVHALIYTKDADGVRAWGLVTSIRLPGGGALGLYQPKHPTAIETR
jgi:hypothetical protein